MGNRKLERFAFDLPPRLRRIFGVPAGAKRRQAAKEAALAAETAVSFTPVVRFAVATDLHLSDASRPHNAERFAALFRTAYRYSDNHPSYRGLDALLLVGDNVDGGGEAEYDALRAVIDANLRSETKLIPVMGNHEYNETGHEGFVRRMGAPLDPHETVKGFHVIGLSTDPTDTWHTPKQALWMLRQLRAARRDDPRKPIFTMQHGHIFKTVYVSRSWYTQLSFLLHPVYALFPQVINFSGHSHGPVNHPLTVWQKRYTAVGAGTLNYFEMERDISDNTVPAGSENAAQYLIVEVDAANRVRILPFNILTDDFFRTPGNLGPKDQLIYLIHDPADRRSFVYTPARRFTDAPPQFAPAATISVDGIAGDAVTLSFPQALSATCVYGYRITAAPAAAPKQAAQTKEIYSEYYLEPMPARCSCTLNGLQPGQNYRISVYPLNIWRDAGRPLTADVTTGAAEQEV